MKKKENYIIVKSIYVSELGLKGNELLVYSLIRSIASSNAYNLFCGSISYLVSWTGCSKPTIQAILNNLCKKHLLVRYLDKDSKNRDKPIYRVCSRFGQTSLFEEDTTLSEDIDLETLEKDLNNF